MRTPFTDQEAKACSQYRAWLEARPEFGRDLVMTRRELDLMGDVQRPEYWPPWPGYYQWSGGPKRPFVPVHIFAVQEIDEAGELLNPPEFQASENGWLLTDRRLVADVWVKCCREPIDAGRYAYLLDLGRWAAAHAPDHSQARPQERVDFLTHPPPTFDRPKRGRKR